LTSFRQRAIFSPRLDSQWLKRPFPVLRPLCFVDHRSGVLGAAPGKARQSSRVHLLRPVAGHRFYAGFVISRRKKRCPLHPSSMVRRTELLQGRICLRPRPGQQPLSRARQGALSSARAPFFLPWLDARRKRRRGLAKRAHPRIAEKGGVLASGGERNPSERKASPFSKRTRRAFFPLRGIRIRLQWCEERGGRKEGRAYFDRPSHSSSSGKWKNGEGFPHSASDVLFQE